MQNRLFPVPVDPGLCLGSSRLSCVIPMYQEKVEG